MIVTNGKNEDWIDMLERLIKGVREGYREVDTFSISGINEETKDESGIINRKQLGMEVTFKLKNVERKVD